jgi:hypothetical protein
VQHLLQINAENKKEHLLVIFDARFVLDWTQCVLNKSSAINKNYAWNDEFVFSAVGWSVHNN